MTSEQGGVVVLLQGRKKKAGNFSEEENLDSLLGWSRGDGGAGIGTVGTYWGVVTDWLVVGADRQMKYDCGGGGLGAEIRTRKTTWNNNKMDYKNNISRF